MKLKNKIYNYYITKKVREYTYKNSNLFSRQLSNY